MSLRIRVYTHTDENGCRHYIFDEAVGAEICRSTLYGSSVIKSLGCTLLPVLFDPSDTEVEGADLDLLEREIANVVQSKVIVILAKQVQGGVDVL